MRPCSAALSLVLTVSLWGCSQEAEVAQPPVLVEHGAKAEEAPVEEVDQSMEDRLAALEARVDLLEQGKSHAEAQEQEAREVYEELKRAHKAGEYAKARSIMGRLAKEYPTTEAYRRSQRIESELSLFDSPVPSDSETHIQEWFTDAKASGAGGNLGWSEGTSLVIFWERWCPSCRKEMPELQVIHDTWASKGLKLLALTRVTRNDTREEVAQFVSEEGLSFPIAKEDGQLASFFKVQALPAAAVIRNGVVIWRGDPKRITDKDLNAWIQD
jgi:thiol-disulfide isomerase/thioredoxin